MLLEFSELNALTVVCLKPYSSLKIQAKNINGLSLGPGENMEWVSTASSPPCLFRMVVALQGFRFFFKKKTAWFEIIILVIFSCTCSAIFCENFRRFLNFFCNRCIRSLIKTFG